MVKKIFIKKILIVVVAAVLLTGCGKDKNTNNVSEETAAITTETGGSETDITEAVSEKEPEKEAEPETENDVKQNIPDNAVVVSTAEEFLGAIASNAYIVMNPGVYNLSGVFRDEEKLADSQCLYKEIINDDYELEVCNVSNLTIAGPTDGKAEIVIEEPYAAVMSFQSCENVSLSNITMGHSVKKGYCTGSVIRVQDSDGFTLDGMDLYGCGTYGIEAAYTNGIKVNNSTIRECSYGIVEMEMCTEVEFDNCILKENEDLDLLYVGRSDVVFKNCIFKDNKTKYDFITTFSHSSIKFMGCSFGEEETDRINELEHVYGGIHFDDNCTFTGQFYRKAITVSNAKELIEAIRPNAVIALEPGTYNLSEYANAIYNERAAQWNSRHEYVQLNEVYDGLEFVVQGVNNLTIYGTGDTRADVEIIIEPRYATVFGFDKCNNIFMTNMTVGHTDTGDCVGDVIGLTNCQEVVVDNMDLYGCGVIGLSLYEASGNVYVYNSRIHDCSTGPIVIDGLNGEFICVNSQLDCSKGGGYIFNNDGGEAFFLRCSFGKKESNYYCFVDPEVCRTVLCEFMEVTEYPDYPDYEIDWEEELDE